MEKTEIQFNRKHGIILALLVGVLLILGFLTYSFLSSTGIFSKLQNDLKSIQSETAAPYTDLDGNPVDLVMYRGKPLIINSWATWTPFSKDELKLLIGAQKTYGDRISILAINRMEQLGVVRSYLETFSLPREIVFLGDPADNFYKVIGGYAMPETIVYNSDGTIHTHKRGVLTHDELIQIIESLLQEPS